MVNKKRLIKTFLELVEIDSPSGEEKKIAQEVTRRLKKLGGIIETDSYGNVIGKFSGKGKPIMLNAHLDTVEPGRNIKPIIQDDIIRTDGSTILGGDPKAGISTILEAVASLRENKTQHPPIEVVFTREEESGLLGAINLDYSKISAKWGITFDGEKDVHNIDISAPGYNRVDATIKGKSAHAGVEPEKGVSAIIIAAEIISKLKLGRIDHETTANIGIIEGGYARNSVPEKLHFKGEIRSRDIKKLEKHTLHFRKIIEGTMKKYPNAKIDLIINREFDSYLFNENHETIKHIIKTFDAMDIKPNLQHSGGGTDVNIFHTHGIKSIVVGTGGYDAHTTREYVVISEMTDAARFCEEIILSSKE